MEFSNLKIYCVDKVIGATGPTGPNGPEEIPSAYFVKFNSSIPVDGYQVASGARLPLDRKEVDNANQYILNLDENTIQFQKTGVYKVQFIVNAKMNATSQSFDINNDFISIGFRQVNDTIVYAGASTWDTNFDVIQLVGQGLFVVNQLTEKYELVNMSKYNLYLMGPKVENTITDSYYVNPLVTIIIEYLG